MNALQKIVAKAFNLQGNSNPSGSPSGALDWADVPKSYPWDWWQKDMPIEDSYSNTTVEACVATISQTVSMLPIQHQRKMPDGGTEIVTNSAAYRVLRKPNPFQTKSAFMVDFVRSMLLKGEGFGVVTRNNRFEIDALYPQRRMSPYISPDNKDVYYSVADQTLVHLDMMVPSRDVLHVCMHTVDHPLRGATPLQAAKLSASTGTSIQGHENRFFANMSRPSGVLTTDMTLTAEQTKELRKRFNEQASVLATGGMPILTSGLKFEPITMSAVDAEIIETYKMTKEDIASVYRVPLALIGVIDKATNFATTEQLMRFWIASGLGYILELIESALDELFRLPSNEHINFDTEFLLESDFKARMDGLKVAVQGGIMTPNEARAKEGLSRKDGLDEALVQIQMVPVAQAADKLAAETEKVRAETDQIGKEPEPVQESAPSESLSEDDDVPAEKAVAVHKTMIDIKAM